MDARLTFGQWVRQRRKALGLTQQDLAQQIGCALSTVQKIEIDDRKPSRPMAELLADYLQVDLTERDAFLHLARSQPATIADLSVVAPPSKTVDNLPAPMTELIGREWEIAMLCACLLQPAVRLLTITGPPGVGKTRLSLAAAQAMRQEFADGVCFVALAPIADGRYLPAAILRALDLADAGGERQLQHLKAWLRDKDLLLVLDNFEHLAPVAPLLIELLEAAPALKILVTSRTLLHLYGEHELVAPPLALPDRKSLAAPADLTHYAAVELFVARARAAKLDFTLNDANKVAVAELCIRFDGLPLAIELAAAHSKQLAPAAILARLQQASHSHGAGLDLLAGGRYLPPRQQTMRKTIAWSYDLLTPTEQRVFRRLGVFAGGCTLEALQAVLAYGAGTPADNRAPTHAAPTGDTWLQATLRALVNQSLVLQAQGPDQAPRFSLLEMLREYALEQLEQQREAEAVHRAHADYYLQVAARFYTASGEGTAPALLGHMATETDNLRAGLQWAREHDLALELRFAAVLAEYWSQRQQLSEGHQWLEQLLPRVAAVAGELLPEQQTQYARLSYMLAFFTWLQGENSLAERRWEKAIALWRQLLNWHELGLALHFLSCVHFDRGDYVRAEAAIQESEQILRAVGEPKALGWALCAAGKISAIRSDFIAAEATIEEALTLFDSAGDLWGISLGHLIIGDVYFMRGDYPRTFACVEEALRTFQQAGQLSLSAETLCMLGKVRWRQGERSEAVALWQESLTMGQEVSGRRYMAEAAFMLGLAAEENGDRSQAQSLYTQSHALYQAVENPIGAAYALCGLASLEPQPGRRAEMLDAAAAVLETKRLPFDQIERDYYERMRHNRIDRDLPAQESFAQP